MSIADERKQKQKGAIPQFERKGVYEDDLSVPDETLIYYSKGVEVYQMILSALFVCGGIYAIFNNLVMVGTITTFFCAVLFFRAFRKHNNKTPQVILNANGIQTGSSQLYYWTSVINDRVKKEGLGKYSQVYLIFDHPDGEERISIEDLDTDSDKLEHLMHVYRARSEKASH